MIGTKSGDAVATPTEMRGGSSLVTGINTFLAVRDRIHVGCQIISTLRRKRERKNEKIGGSILVI
jgi:hypothetical protein